MEGRDGARPPPPNPSMPYREDCWSEGATSALIDAWGDRYLELNRGNLRQKDWQEVADAVNARRGGAHRPPRTDSQCKNRIDTLKKKYKTEKARIMDGVGSSTSPWPFFPHLDTLIGASPNNASSSKKPPHSASPPLALPLPSYRKPAATPLPAARAVDPPKRHAPLTSLPTNGFLYGKNNYSAAAAAAAAAAADGDSASSANSSRDEGTPPRLTVKRVRVKQEEEGDGEEDGIRQLAQAIDRFTEIYEKVEGDKQRQTMELEKQRMEFAKELEFQRMQFFVDSQVQLEKIKRSRRAGAGEQGLSAALSFLFQPAVLNM